MELINFSFNWFIVAIIWNSHIMILHGTKIRTGITCKKICCYMCNSACRWLIVQNAQIFRSYVKQFWIFPHEGNCKIFIGLCKHISMNHPILFLDWNNNKTKLLAVSFSYFLELMWEKINFGLKSVIVITVLISFALWRNYLNCFISLLNCFICIAVT